jgi:hypothetical protein
METMGATGAASDPGLSVEKHVKEGSRRVTRRLLSGRAGGLTTTSACDASDASDAADAVCNNPSCPNRPSRGSSGRSCLYPLIPPLG